MPSSSQTTGVQPEPLSTVPLPVGGGAATVADGDGAGVWAVAVGAGASTVAVGEAGVAGVDIGDGWAGSGACSMIGSST